MKKPGVTVWLFLAQFLFTFSMYVDVVGFGIFIGFMDNKKIGIITTTTATGLELGRIPLLY